MATLLQRLRFRNYVSRVFLFGCALALATIVSPQEVLAQTPRSVTICKRTIPSPDTSGTSFNFTWAEGSVSQPAFQLKDGNCNAINTTANYQLITIKETPSPPLGSFHWTLTYIHCNNTTSDVNITGTTGAGANPAFQPGDNTVVIKQSEPNVTCTFYNTFWVLNVPTELMVQKIVSPDPRGIGSTLSFAITVTCAGVSYPPLNVQGNFYNLILSPPVGSTCSFTETRPILPAGCTWHAPQYSPATVTIAGGMNFETVINGYSCKKKWPPVDDIDTQKACPPGTVQKGRECVRPIVCRPPQVLNAAGKVCICPPGTVRKGRECVRPIECRKPMIANRTGTECICPPPMQQRGRECVPPGRPNVDGPRGNPHDPRGGNLGPADLPGRR